MMLRVTIGVVMLVVLLTMLWPHPAQKPIPPASNEKILPVCYVMAIYDGDTIGCDINHNRKIDGNLEHLRLLGIDSPEMSYSRKNKSGRNQPFAQAAFDFTEQHILGKRIFWEVDRQPYDKYDRPLVFVYLDRDKTQMLNRMLLEQGLAKTLFIGVNRRFESDFENTQAFAKQARRGIWSIR